MAALSQKKLAAHAAAVLEVLARVYPGAYCELTYSNPLELLVATILSAQCTDKRVNLVTTNLFQRCRSARDYAEIDLRELEQLVQSTGFFRAKARNIQACCSALLHLHHGSVPADMDALTALAGVGRKTANVVLGNAFNINLGIVVDTHVKRLAFRLGLTKNRTPEKVERDLIKLVPREHWTQFSHWLIWHGRRRCTARNPACADCELQMLCPQIGVARKR